MFNNPETIAIAMKIPSGICENSPRKGILKNELKKIKKKEKETKNTWKSD